VAHFHGPAGPGENAGVLEALPFGNPKIGTWKYDEAVEEDILNGNVYVNIHTEDNGGGEIRGQIVDMVSVMNGGQEVPPTASGGSGYGLFNINALANEIDYHIVVEALDGVESAAHIHGFAVHVTNADVIHDLGKGSPKTGTWTYDEADEVSILHGQTYVNVHSDISPSGEIRGQVVRSVAPLDSQQEVPPVEAAGYGCALVTIAPASDILTYYFRHEGLTGPATAAHIHGFADPGENAGVKHNVGTDSPVVGTWFFAVQDEAEILASRTYFNVHTEANGGGEVRGQVVFSGRPCPIDISCSGAVDFDDILMILDGWGDDGGPADIDDSGSVDFEDLLLVLGNFGPCPGL